MRHNNNLMSKDDHLENRPEASLFDMDDEFVFVGLKVSKIWLRENFRFLEQLARARCV